MAASGTGEGGHMLRLRKVVLFWIVLALPRLTLAQTVFETFDLSGSIALAGGSTLGTFSVTLGIAITNDVCRGCAVYQMVSWNISTPSFTGPGGLVGAFTFTPTNSTFASVPLGSADDPTGWAQEFISPASGRLFTFSFGPPLNYLPLTSTTSVNVTYYYGGTGYVGPGLVTPAVTPEPSTLILVGSGLASGR